MNRILVFPTLAFALVSATQVFAAPHSEVVHFSSAGPQPTPFQIKQAEAKGQKLEVKPGITLDGFLTKPDGSGPFPAVVLLHGCNGVRDFEKTWANAVAEAGLVALLIDSHGSRGIREACDRTSIVPSLVNFANDALGALSYLSAQSFVRPNTIGIIGWDAGAWALLSVMSQNGYGQFSKEKFAAATAFYPWVAETEPTAFIAPILLVFGGKDDLTPGGRVERFVSRSSALSGNIPIVVKTYPEAVHFFDDPEYEEKILLPEWYNSAVEGQRGVTAGYDKASAEDARQLVTRFFGQTLGH